jgi:tetratricopeptide (TPR) repeat protein
MQHRGHEQASRVRTGFLILALGVGAPDRVAAQGPGPTGHTIGTVHFPVTCHRAAQREFDRGAALLHHMTYPQARAAFEEAARADPRCAMAQWGIAMTLFQPLWPTRPTPAELRRGWDAVVRARALGAPTERERLFVDAAAAFFQDPASTDYWARLRRWQDAMSRLHAVLPNDEEGSAFYALSLLAVAPADSLQRAYAERATELLLAVYARNPDHPGALHYLVHAYDAPGRERDSLAIVRGYEAVAPDNPHALHMPTHIYTRVGEWSAVIDGNRRAAAAALRYPAGEKGEWVWDEFPHAVEYLIYAHLQRGEDQAASTELARLLGTARLQPTFKTAFHLASSQARYALERGAWDEARALAPRIPATLDWDRYPWAEGVTWYAKGMGAARQGTLGEAGSARDRLMLLEGRAESSGEVAFARQIRVLRLELQGWIAEAGGDHTASERSIREAAALEEATPKPAVTPAPTLPAFEVLGDLLMAQGRAAQAVVAYRHSLELYPRRFNSLLGAARALRASGDTAAARAHYRELLEVGRGGDRTAAIGEAREFLR